jgi:hypothetical protein
MNLSAYRIITLCYLAPLLLTELVANTTATGAAADASSFIFGVTILLMAFAALPWIGHFLGLDVLKAKGFEWIFNAGLVAFCLFTFFWMRGVNTTSTNWFVSPFALIWEWLSIGIGVLAFAAFWAVKGNTLKHVAHDIKSAASE